MYNLCKDVSHCSIVYNSKISKTNMSIIKVKTKWLFNNDLSCDRSLKNFFKMALFLSEELLWKQKYFYWYVLLWYTILGREKDFSLKTRRHFHREYSSLTCIPSYQYRTWPIFGSEILTLVKNRSGQIQRINTMLF